MSKEIQKTGLNFSAGEKLSARSLNKMNSTINELVDPANEFISSFYNLGDDNPCTLEEALKIVPTDRQKPGLMIRFKDSTSGDYSDYIFKGGDWNKTENWNLYGFEFNVVDGGAWSMPDTKIDPEIGMTWIEGEDKLNYTIDDNEE